jgi:hypothetical protein
MVYSLCSVGGNQNFLENEKDLSDFLIRLLV